MMTSRAEHRLYLRQDNAEQRLTPIGYNAGLVPKSRYLKLKKQQEEQQSAELILNQILSPTTELNQFLTENNEALVKSGISVRNLLKRPNIDIYKLNKKFNLFKGVSRETLQQLNIIAKYEGYIAIQNEQVERAIQNEEIKLPEDIDYSKLNGLRLEARQKLNKIRPINLGQASRISGVSPADISILTIYLKKLEHQKKDTD